MELIDIGVNLAHDSFDADRDAVMQRAADAGVTQMIVTGASEDGTRQAIRLAQAHPGRLFATAGRLREEAWADSLHAAYDLFEIDAIHQAWIEAGGRDA